ncbi:MAG: polysulfide reductase NrfD [Proteobacteria bacterium]|nr:polysulfide reductase NrfD [Pseudomonadota bacterium]MDA1022395.1 polysulfide reductase NrfD [Pseudomonadota bacterium]
MNAELLWGMPVIGYLFLAGVGAGALTVSASVLLRGGGGGFAGQHYSIARYGAFIAPLPLMIGCGLLIFELGSFDAGHWFKWINLYKTINLSPMSIGTWLLTAFIGVSVLYAYTFLPKTPGLGDYRDGLRTLLAWLCVPLGIATAVYTGVLLGAMPARPFWNSPILAMLFLVSSLSTGVAVILLFRALFPGKEEGAEGKPMVGDYFKRRDQSAYILTASDLLLVGFELLVIGLFIMYAHLTVGAVKEAVSVILLGGNLAALFWFGVVAVGLVAPALIELYYVIPRLLGHQPFDVPMGVEIIVPIAILIGGFLLRYVVVIAGQITGPVGI